MSGLYTKSSSLYLKRRHYPLRPPLGRRRARPRTPNRKESNRPAPCVEKAGFFGPAVEIGRGRSSPHRQGTRLGHFRMKESVMKYMLLIYGNEAGMLAASKETSAQMLAAYGAYTEAMKKAGVHVGSNRLRPTT